MKKEIVLALAAMSLVSSAALADEGVRFPPIDHAATLKECGTCHLAFPPQMLPGRSWEKLMSDLANHFGENAALDASARDDIANYLASHAADGPATKGGAKYIAGIAKDAMPIRITETPYWIGEHREIKADRFKDPKVKSKVNCTACHSTAGKGQFLEEDD